MSHELVCPAADDEELCSSIFLRRDVEEISKALHLHTREEKVSDSIEYRQQNVVTRSKSDVSIRDPLHKEKKPPKWNWKPLKALIHFGCRRFNCNFFLHIHAIEGLPPDFDNLSFCVTWKRKAEILRTQPAKVSSGMAEFEETLVHRCSIRCGTMGSHRTVRYESKEFLLRPFLIEAPSLDFGKHLIDLSRLLPLTLDGLDKDNRSSGKWTTSFRLAGKMNAAILNVTFGFSIADGNTSEQGQFLKVPHTIAEDGLNHLSGHDRNKRTSKLRNLDSFSTFSTGGSLHKTHSSNAKLRDGIFPSNDSELFDSVSLLYQKLDDGIKRSHTESDLYFENFGLLNPEFDPSDELLGLEMKGLEFDVIEQGVEVSMKDRLVEENSNRPIIESSYVESIDVAEIFKEVEASFDENSELNCVLDMKSDNSRTIHEPAFEGLDSALCDAENDMDFMSCFQSGRIVKLHNLNDIAESIENDFLSMLSIGLSQDEVNSDIDRCQSIDHMGEMKQDAPAWRRSTVKTDTSSSSCSEVKFMDNFDLSFWLQPTNKNHVNEIPSLRSRRNAEMLENLETEALMHEWGLNEEAFQYSMYENSDGFGSPVYIPEEEPINLPSIEDGIGSMIQTKDGGFLRSLNPLLFRNANDGARLIVQISAPLLLSVEIRCNIIEILQCWASFGVEAMCMQIKELMPLEDITGKAMLQVLLEAESAQNASSRGSMHEGYHGGQPTVNPSEQIDSDMVSFKDIVPLSIEQIAGLLVEGLKIQSDMADQEPPTSLPSEGVPCLCSLDVNELIKQSFYMKDFGTNTKLLSSNFKMAFKVQLRDPLRNYEMVGCPMLALIQAHKITVSGESEMNISDPLFKLSDALIAGLNLFQVKKELWGNCRQQQSGSRWLLSSGMVKANKKTLSLNSGSDVLWSISRPNEGEAVSWNKQVSQNVCTRNPDIIFPNDPLM